MALVNINGLFFPPTLLSAASPNTGSSVIDATGEKYAWIGRVTWADKSVSSRAIRRARFLFGSVTKAGGSALTFSLQNVDTANGPPAQPDGTQDQTVAIANANAAFLSNTYITTGDLSADRTVSLGEYIAAVLEYDGSGRLGADSVAISHILPSTGILADGPSLFTASWATVGAFNGIVFECADGAVATLDPALPTSSSTATLSFNSGSAADEVALKFTPDFACRIDALWASCFPTGIAADFDVVLYQGTTVLQTVSVDANTAPNTSTPRTYILPIAETTLTAGVTYYVALKPTTANNVTMRYVDVSSSAIRDLLPGGAQCSYSTRADAGAWSDTDTRYPYLGVRLSAIDNGAGGGGLAANPVGGFIV